MLRGRVLARLLIPAFGAVAIQTVAAEEPAAPPPPPAKSIHEWRMTPEQAAAASAEATPTAPAKSIREWRTTAAPAPAPCPMTAPIANLAAAPAARPSSKSAAAPTSPITISLKSTLRQGSLVVMLDDVPVFNEKFQKPLLIISQTTTWDPLQIKAGTHRLTAKVYGKKKTYFSKSYDLEVSTKGAALRFVMQGDKLTVALGS